MVPCRAHATCSLIAIALLAGRLAAADPDPFATLDTRANLQVLAAARDALGQAPASDHRLVAAEMALVNLALAGDPRDRGGRGGVWRLRARELRELRRAAAPLPTALPDALPDLWIDALDGRTADVLAALDRLAGSGDLPQVRALRCFATADWRQLRARPDPTPHERLALAVAYWRCGMGQALEALPHADLPGFAYATLQVATEGFSHAGSAEVLSSALAETPQLAASPHLPASARPAVASLAAALGSQPDGGLGAAMAKALRDDPDHGDIVLAAWRLATAGLEAQHGLRDPAGAWQLISAGDWAASARLHIFLGTYHRHYFVRYQWGVPESADQLAKPIADGDQELFGSLHRLIASNWRDLAAAHRVLAGIAPELERNAAGVPPARLIGCVDQLRVNIRSLSDDAKQAMQRLLAAQRSAEPGRAAGWEEIGRGLEGVGLLAEAANDLATAAQADPWSPELERLAKQARDGGKAQRAADDPVLAAQIARMPWHLDLLARRFEGLCEAGRWADAEPMGAAILAAEPGYERIGRRHGECLQKLGRTDDALAAWRDYLAHSDAFDTIYVHEDIAKALETKGDLAGAEREFLAAANSWQSGAMRLCAQFLARHDRKSEAMVWVEREIERYGRRDGDLFAASILLDHQASAGDADAAIARLAAHKDELLPHENDSRVWGLGADIRRNMLHDRFLALVEDRWRTAPNCLGTRVGILLAESGRGAEAVDWFAAELEGNRTNARARGWVMAWQTLAARSGKRPDLAPKAEELRAQIGHGNFIAPIDPLLRYLAGDIDRATALAQAGKDADELHYYLAFDAIAGGDLATARSDLAVVLTHADWGEAGGARRLLQWIDAGAKTPPPVQPAVKDF